MASDVWVELVERAFQQTVRQANNEGNSFRAKTIGSNRNWSSARMIWVGYLQRGACLFAYQAELLEPQGFSGDL